MTCGVTQGLQRDFELHKMLGCMNSDAQVRGGSSSSWAAAAAADSTCPPPYPIATRGIPRRSCPHSVGMPCAEAVPNRL